MSLRAKVRGQWRIVSKAMARRFRARGIEVVETDAPAPAALSVTPAAELPPAHPAAVLATFIMAPEPAFDLTDDELERLTAPGGDEV